MLRQRHLTTVVVRFLIGCVVLLGVGCSGTRSEAPKEKQQGRTQATNTEQGRAAEATQSEEEARCEGMRSFSDGYTTNDLPACANKGGLLLGTDMADKLDGNKGEDEIRGLGANDDLIGGDGNDHIYGFSGEDAIEGNHGEDVYYGGDGSDSISTKVDDDRQRDKLYCGEGKDYYDASKNDFVSSSCEKAFKGPRPVP